MLEKNWKPNLQSVITQSAESVRNLEKFCQSMQKTAEDFLKKLSAAGAELEAQGKFSEPTKSESAEISEPTKVCCVCNRELPVSKFWRQTGAKDGCQSYCKECGRKYPSRQRRVLKENPRIPSEMRIATFYNALKEENGGKCENALLNVEVMYKIADNNGIRANEVRRWLYDDVCLSESTITNIHHHRKVRFWTVAKIAFKLGLQGDAPKALTLIAA